MVKQSVLRVIGMSHTTTAMTKESLAAMLNGREYGNEMSLAEESAAKSAGLAVVFGYSDDNVELRGAISDELGCYGGGEFYVTRKGVHMEPNDEERETLEKFGVLDQVVGASRTQIRAVWCGPEGYSWTYKTDIPHATFDIMEDGEKYCRGIVFSLEDLP